MFSRGLRSETRSKAKEDLKKIVSTIEYVRKWEKKWVHIKDTSLTVYKWIPSAEQNFARHKPKPYQASDKARFALSGPDSAAAAAAAATSDGVAGAAASPSAPDAANGSASGASASANAAAAASPAPPAAASATAADVDMDSSVNGDSNMSYPIAGADFNSPANLLDDDTKSESTEFTASQCPGGASEDNTNSDMLSCSQDPSQEGPPAKRTKPDFN